MCVHEYVEKKKRVTPPRAVSYEMRYMECSICGDITATPEQRKRNKKQYNYAFNKYQQNSTSLWGVGY